MFERFTDKARTVVKLSQASARDLSHDHIGPEHILLALVSMKGSVGQRALDSMGVSREQVYRQIEERLGHGAVSPGRHIPFTKSAKKVLELSLREALLLGHNYIGTEHILLGLLRSDATLSHEILADLGVNLMKSREVVIALMTERGLAMASGEGVTRTSPSRAADVVAGPACSGCSADLTEVARYTVAEVPEHHGEGHAQVLFLFCSSCGRAIDNLILPAD